MQTITNISNPSLFVDVSALPTGYHYILGKIGEYVYGTFNNTIYQMGVVREADGVITWNNGFYPNDGYPSVAQMIQDEANAAFNNWQQYYLADQIASSAVTLIGF